MKDRPAAILVKDLMKTHVRSVHPEDDIDWACRYLIESHLSNIPVVEQETGGRRLVGFLSEADCMKPLASEAYFNQPGLRVKDIMRANPFVLHLDDDLYTVARYFMEYRYRHIPCVDESGYLVGMVNRRDVLRQLMTMRDDFEAAQNSAREVRNLRELVNHRHLLL
jgi:CBS domain-containing protein